MLALVIVAVVPPLALAASNIELQVTVTDEPAAAGHYGFMAAFGFTVIGVGASDPRRDQAIRVAQDLWMHDTSHLHRRNRQCQRSISRKAE